MESQASFRTEILLSRLLSYGVALCLALLGIGLALQLTGIHVTGEDALQLKLDRGEQGRQMIHALMSGQILPAAHPDAPTSLPETLIGFGIILLIALPITRVALTLVIFVFERDWVFVAITGVVLSTLLTGILLGHFL